ncbi:MAG TPA: glucose-1-phosphate thymidylyltransferase [Bacilli bacterium]|nr:glucose-1-phosphate thymidylyltransferase [Bacilli bacterium]
MKGIILCAGKATRMQPYSFTQPKTLLPVAGRPVLDHCLDNMRQAGIEEIAIVINPRQKQIIDHVSRSQPNLQVRYIHQRKQRGILHAVKMAEDFIDDDPFVLMLGDNLISEPLTTLLDSFDGHHGAILLSEVENPSDYGIATIEDDRIIRIQEKPKKPPSNLAVIGAYVFDGDMLDAFDHIKPSARGEYEITDAIQWLIDSGRSVSFSLTTKPYSDVGTAERWLEANRWMLRQRAGDGVIVGDNTVLDNCKLIPPVVIGRDCELTNATIGPYVSLQDDCELEDCRIEHSICLENTVIQHVKQPITHSIFGRDTELQGDDGDPGKLQCLLGDKSKLWVMEKKRK